MLEGLFRRRRLPHWDVEDGTYFVTACLAGSIPAEGLLDLYRYREELAERPKPKDLDEDEWEIRQHKLVFGRFDDLIDRQPAVKHLENPAAADLVCDAIWHFAGDRYDLIAYVVMPSHFHWVFHPRRPWVESLCQADAVGQTFQSAPPGQNARPTARQRTPRERIMQSIKGITAYRCNRLLGSSGTFWQDEAYDHVVRDDEELLRIIHYVEQNPVKAGLVAQPEEWRWSSARGRRERNVVPGAYLLK